MPCATGHAHGSFHVRSCGSSCAWDSAPKLVTSVRRSVPTARHASSVEGVRRARPLHGHGASRVDRPGRTVQLGAAIAALEWVAHVPHSPRFDARPMLLRLASSNTCPAECSCSMHAARSEWITSIRPVTGLCPRELAGAVDHVPCEHQLCAAACQTVQRTVLWCHAHRGRRTRSRDLSCAGGVVQAMNSTSCTSRQVVVSICLHRCVLSMTTLQAVGVSARQSRPTPVVVQRALPSAWTAAAVSHTACA